jgi:hypothetical protein
LNAFTRRRKVGLMDAQRHIALGTPSFYKGLVTIGFCTAQPVIDMDHFNAQPRAMRSFREYHGINAATHSNDHRSGYRDLTFCPPIPQVLHQSIPVILHHLIGF